MIHYKPVKVTIDALSLVKVIFDVVIQYYGFLDSIISDHSSVFTSKFCLLLCYFLEIKQRLFTTFYLQTDGRTKKQNSIIEAYLRVFVNFKQYDWARLQPMADFVYTNAKNASTSHTPFKLNCGYHPRVF